MSPTIGEKLKAKGIIIRRRWLLGRVLWDWLANALIKSVAILVTDGLVGVYVFNDKMRFGRRIERMLMTLRHLIQPGLLLCVPCDPMDSPKQRRIQIIPTGRASLQFRVQKEERKLSQNKSALHKTGTNCDRWESPYCLLCFHNTNFMLKGSYWNWHWLKDGCRQNILISFIFKIREPRSQRLIILFLRLLW